MCPTLKVFCIGFHKTGTTSLSRALEWLGLRCAHYSGLLLEDWAADRHAPIFAAVADCDAFRDWPWPLMFREVDRRFPESRFILTLRHEESWIESLKRHAERTGPTRAREIVYGHAMPHGREAAHRQVYRRHNADALAYFGDRDHLLVLPLENGPTLDALARFLGRPTPSGAYPHLFRSADRGQRGS